MPNNNVIQQDISDKLAYNYTQYALSVITDRAIPDLRDGLKVLAPLKSNL